MATVKGAVALLLISLNAIAWCTLLYLACLPCLLMPGGARRSAYVAHLHGIVDGWVAINHAILSALHITQMRIDGVAGLSRADWSLVVSNHQTWADIIVLQCSLRPYAPVLKFFMKRELIWVPFIGVACWLLDFPFMRRYSPAVLERHPELRNKDRDTTRRACARFRLAPTAVLNFAEGTRFSRAKQASQTSPHAHLLRPRAGGLGFVLADLGDKLDSILDVTIDYGSSDHGSSDAGTVNGRSADAYRAPSFWEFLCGRNPHVAVHVRALQIPSDLIGGDYANDDQYRMRVRDWVDALWMEKDRKIAHMRAG